MSISECQSIAHVTNRKLFSYSNLQLITEISSQSPQNWLTTNAYQCQLTCLYRPYSTKNQYAGDRNLQRPLSRLAIFTRVKSRLTNASRLRASIADVVSASPWPSGGGATREGSGLVLSSNGPRGQLASGIAWETWLDGKRIPIKDGINYRGFFGFGRHFCQTSFMSTFRKASLILFKAFALYILNRLLPNYSPLIIIRMG